MLLSVAQKEMHCSDYRNLSLAAPCFPSPPPTSLLLPASTRLPFASPFLLSLPPSPSLSQSSSVLPLLPFAFALEVSSDFV